MSWKITAGWSPADADAAAYITAVETADAQALENGVKVAIDNFVLGCKADGIWTAIKASCILAGARTLTGALVPLVGTAPTNVGGLFASGDYDRKTGLKGNGSTKYLNSNRASNADPQNSNHICVYHSEVPSAASNFPRSIGAETFNVTGATGIILANASNRWEGQSRNAGNVLNTAPASRQTGTVIVNRANSTQASIRVGGSSYTQSFASQTPGSNTFLVFNDQGLTNHSNARIAFYSIGESLDLALLDTRVTTLIQAIDAAI
jgi:hypothetical protein